MFSNVFKTLNRPILGRAWFYIVKPSVAHPHFDMSKWGCGWSLSKKNRSSPRPNKTRIVFLACVNRETIPAKSPYYERKPGRVSASRGKGFDPDPKPPSNSIINQQLVMVFQQIKDQVMQYDDPKLIKYYHVFFKQFTSEIVLKNLVKNHGHLAQEIVKPFHRVCDLNTFKRYLQSIPGLYPQLVLWAIENPFPNVFSRQGPVSIQIKHHAMPKFLIKYYGFKESQIETHYNIVKTSWSFHFFLHLIRFFEYHQIQDFVALNLTLQHPVSFKKNNKLEIVLNKKLLNESHLYELLDGFLNENLIPNMLANPEFEQEFSAHLSSIRSSTETKHILTTRTTWRHKLDFFKKPGACVELIFEAQDVKNCSIKRFSIQFVNQLETYYKQVFNKPVLSTHEHENDRLIESTTARLSMYFRGYTGSVSDFYIVDPPSFIKPVAVVGNNQYSQNRKVQRDPEQEDLLSKIRFTVTHKNPKVPIVRGEPGQFKSFYDITKKCCQLEHKYLNNDNSEIITPNKRANHSLSEYFKRILLFDNPVRKRKSRSTTGLTRNKPRSTYHHCRGWTVKKEV